MTNNTVSINGNAGTGFPAGRRLQWIWRKQKGAK